MFTVTGTSKSRLNELRKYTTQGSLSQLYFTSLSPSNDGVDVSLTVTGQTGQTGVTTYTYYIGGITYVDTTPNSGQTSTTFSFQSLGQNDPNNFISAPIVKNFNQENIVDKPEVDADVFIERQSITVFEDQYRLRNLTNISDLVFYAGGGHFNIIDNT